MHHNKLLKLKAILYLFSVIANTSLRRGVPVYEEEFRGKIVYSKHSVMYFEVLFIGLLFIGLTFIGKLSTTSNYCKWNLYVNMWI